MNATQGDLFEEATRQRRKVLEALRAACVVAPPHPANAPITSRAGAVHVAPRAPSQMVQVLRYIATRTVSDGGATDWDGTNALGMLKSSYTARRRTLEKAWLVRVTGATKESAYGAENAIYEALPDVVAVVRGDDPKRKACAPTAAASVYT